MKATKGTPAEDRVGRPRGQKQKDRRKAHGVHVDDSTINGHLNYFA